MVLQLPHIPYPRLAFLARLPTYSNATWLNLARERTTTRFKAILMKPYLSLLVNSCSCQAEAQTDFTRITLPGPTAYRKYRMSHYHLAQGLTLRFELSTAPGHICSWSAGWAILFVSSHWMAFQI